MDALGDLLAKLLGAGRQGNRHRGVRVALVDEARDFARRPVHQLGVVGRKFNPYLSGHAELLLMETR
jgi:hypothetical protein